MSSLLNFFAVKLESLSYRLSLFNEIDLLKSKGRFIPSRAKSLVWSEPSSWDDFVQFLCFFDNNEFVNLIDVGANVGRFSSDFHLFFPRNHFIVCIEPNPLLKPVLEKSTAHIPNVEIFNVGVGEVPGAMTLKVPKQAGATALGSFLEFNDDANQFYGVSQIEAHHVKIDTLDNLVGERNGPTIVKIDTQGFEEKVIRGGTGVIARSDAILLECSFAPMHQGVESTFNSCAALAFDLGFVPVVFQRYGTLINTYAFERDVLFVKKERSRKIFHKNY